jgi:hypothetical protein
MSKEVRSEKNGTLLKRVYPLWFRGIYGTYLFGIYTSREEAEQGKKKYQESGRCDDGCFQPIKPVPINSELAPGYL